MTKAIEITESEYCEICTAYELLMKARDRYKDGSAKRQPYTNALLTLRNIRIRCEIDNLKPA